MPSQSRVPGLVTAAELRAHGVPPSRLVGVGYVRATRGVYLPSDSDLDDPATRVAAVAARLPPSVAIGGWAAALMHERRARGAGDGITVFDGYTPAMDSSARGRLPVLVCGPRSARLRPSTDSRLFRSDLDQGEVMELDGIPVTTPLRTAFDLARLWPTTAGVVALDRMANLRLVSLVDVSELVAARQSWVGVGRARRALARADAGSESPRESMLRLLWLDAGLPRPLCNPDIHDARGAFLARVDLLDDAVGLVAEYDGADHASAQRRHRDAVRQEGLEQAGLVVLRANDPDIASETGRRAWRVRLVHAHRRAAATARARGWTAHSRP